MPRRVNICIAKMLIMIRNFRYLTNRLNVRKNLGVQLGGGAPVASVSWNQQYSIDKTTTYRTSHQACMQTEGQLNHQILQLNKSDLVLRTSKHSTLVE